MATPQIVHYMGRNGSDWGAARLSPSGTRTLTYAWLSYFECFIPSLVCLCFVLCGTSHEWERVMFAACSCPLRRTSRVIWKEVVFTKCVCIYLVIVFFVIE